MNLAEKYALNCGVKIREPFVSTSYFPIPIDPYIIIDNRSRDPSSVYDLFSDVIGYIKPFLQERGIRIISFSKDEKNTLADTEAFTGLFKKQEAFFIKHAKLVVGPSDLSNHIANALGVPSVGLYSSYPSNSKVPIWGDKHSIVESHRDGNLPSYGSKEEPKTINLIKPEAIASHILCYLGVPDQIQHNSIYIGGLYPVKVVEVIPDFAPQQGALEGRAINLRMDYHFDERLASHWINNRVVNILMDKPMDLKLLEYFKKNIAQITININESFSEEYLKSIQSIGINLQIFCENNKEINDYRFKFFDFEINKSLFQSKKDLGDAQKILQPNTKFLTGKILISQGKKYSCYEAKRAGKELTNQPELIYDTDEFWKELDHYRLINEL